MRTLLLVSAALAAPLALANPAMAQDGDTPIIVTGQGLDVTPSASAYSTIELSREQLQSTGSGRIEDALSNIAGFQQFRRSDSRSANPTAQGATLRALGGNASSRALVVLDGVPMIDPFFGHVPFTALSPDRLEVIQVTRGGGSGPFGAGALAGTIELQSADASTMGFLSGQALVNDRGDTELSANLAPQWDDGFAVISGRWDRGDGFWTTPEDQRAAISTTAAFDSWSAGGRVVQNVGEDLQVQGRVLAFEDNRTLRFEGADNMNRGQDVSLRLIGRGDWQFDVLGYGQWRNFSNIVISSSRFVPVLDQHDTPASGFGGKVEVRPPVGGNNVLRLGADFRQSEGDLTEYRYSAFTGNGNGSRYAGGTNSDLGLFIENDWKAGNVLVTGGVRADRWSIRDGYHLNLNPDGSVDEDSTYADRSGWDVSWRVGASVDVGEVVRLRGAAYTGLRLPTLNELYRPFVVFPVTTMANAELENEHLEGFEGGIDFIPNESFRLSLTVFDNRVENAIANVTLVPGSLRQRRNLDSIHATGAEIGAQIGTGPVKFTGTFAYSDTSVEGSGASADLDGNRPSQTPNWSSSATVSWEPATNWLLSATLRHVGDQFETDTETGLLPAATTVDVFAKVPLTDNVAVVLRGENLFDEEIITRNQDGSMDLGTPLTVWGGFRFSY